MDFELSKKAVTNLNFYVRKFKEDPINYRKGEVFARISFAHQLGLITDCEQQVYLDDIGFFAD